MKRIASWILAICMTLVLFPEQQRPKMSQKVCRWSSLWINFQTKCFGMVETLMATQTHHAHAYTRRLIKKGHRTTVNAIIMMDRFNVLDLHARSFSTHTARNARIGQK